MDAKSSGLTGDRPALITCRKFNDSRPIYPQNFVTSILATQYQQNFETKLSYIRLRTVRHQPECAKRELVSGKSSVELIGARYQRFLLADLGAR